MDYLDRLLSDVPVDSRLEDYIRLVETQKQIINGLDVELADSRKALAKLQSDIRRAWGISRGDIGGIRRPYKRKTKGEK